MRLIIRLSNQPNLNILTIYHRVDLSIFSYKTGTEYIAQKLTNFCSRNIPNILIIVFGNIFISIFCTNR